MQDRTDIVWNEDETTLALYLYYLIESGQVENRSKAINDLATFLGRSRGSVEMKIGNLQSCDKKNTKGLPHGSKTDSLIFDRYLLHPDVLDITAKRIIDKNPAEAYLIPSIVDANPYAITKKDEMVLSDYTGSETARIRKERNDQDSFRNRLLANYDQKCCLSGVSTTQLLIASHIVPWSKDKSKRLDPRNGLLFNAYLDRAFDKGIITIDSRNYSVLISDKLKDERALDYFNQYRGKEILLPKNDNVWPDKQNLQYHNDVIFGKYEESDIRDFPSFEQYQQNLLAM